MSLQPEGKFQMERNTTKAHCLCRPSAVRLNLILMRDGESYIALNRLPSPVSVFNRGSRPGQTCIWIHRRIQSERADSSALGMSDQNRRRQLGTGCVWLSQHSERSTGERELRHNDTSLAALDGDDHHGTNQAHSKQKSKHPTEWELTCHKHEYAFSNYCILSRGWWVSHPIDFHWKSLALTINWCTVRQHHYKPFQMPTTH